MLVTAALLTFLLGACSNNDASSSNSNSKKEGNSISQAQLNKREEGIVSTLTNNSFVFDFNIKNTYKNVSLWVEKYEFGKLTKEKMNHLTNDIQGKGNIIFATTAIPDKPSQLIFNIGVSNNDSITANSELETIMEGNLEDVGGTWEGNPSAKKPIEGDMVLASLSYKKGGNNMHSLSSDFYDNPSKHLEDIEDYDVVYLLRAKFN
ncbi:hypothetical protein U8V72_20005 [Priestia filamentosa]|uniref:hypothetical protein n=1 Tax=Priestia filamentosa TaxID=1402861 RepID=UPI00397A2161